MSNDQLSFKEMKEIKDIYLAKKQGEALERASTPQNFWEAISLGKFGHQTVYALGVIHIHQKNIESLTGYKGNILTDFVEDIGRGSGSIAAERLKGSFETVGQLGQYIPMLKHQRQAPEMVELND